MPDRELRAAQRVAAGAHVILVGLPGAGKSAVGRELARQLRRPFVDFDEEIVRREGRTIPEIFASEGEAYFRRLEAALTREAAHARGWVIAPGGGWVLQRGLVQELREFAVTVHLRVSPETAVKRMGRDIALRPLLSAGDPVERARALWAERKERYEQADVEVDTEGLAIGEVATALVLLIVRSVEVTDSGNIRS